MKRQIIELLKDWKISKNRKPLIIRGARQVGKSYTIKQFGEQHFEGKIHIINLEKRPDWHAVFEENLEINRIISELEILLNTTISIATDLLFFDEIQECPSAILALRYFYEDMPDLHVIAAGSLLEFVLDEISFPVGRVQMMNMHPMSFSEFLLAMGKEKLAKIIKEEPKKLSASIDNVIKQELKNYFFVGGLPECVKTFRMSSKFSDVQQIQTDLINTYRQDFSKYKPQADSRCINDVLSAVSGSVGQQLKYVKLSNKFTGPTIKKALGLLSTARLIHQIHASSPAGLPLSSKKSPKVFKAILLDIGLLVRLSGLSLSAQYHDKNLLNIFNGALAEQFVGQEFLANGHENLFYWSRQAKSSSAEVDYIIQNGSEVQPIEVKNSSAGRLKSLHILLTTYPKVNEAKILYDGPFGLIKEQKLCFLPLYYAGTLVP